MAWRHKLFLAMSFAIGSAAPAFAAILTPGESAALDGIPAPTGTVLAQSTQSIFGDSALTSTVIRDDGTGDLDFVYSLTGDILILSNAISASVAGFSNISTDLNFVTPTGFVHPNRGLRSPDGDTVTFDQWGIDTSDPSISPLVVKTNAQDYADAATLTLILAGEGVPPGPVNITLTAEVFAPLSVPEPSTAGVLVLVGGIWALRRRLKPNQQAI